MNGFTPQCLPLLLGSLPLADHRQAIDVIFQATPEIPLWPQLPLHKEEGMILQFLPGFPGKTESEGKVFIDASAPGINEELVLFYQEYIDIVEGKGDLSGSRFSMTPEAARGFFAFLDHLRDSPTQVTALKGQITGPITFCTAITDESGRALFYNDQLRDAAVKMLSLKARWQIKKMREYCETAIVFFDEPGLAGFGSSAFITISPEDIRTCLNEAIASVHAENGLAGIHVCANTEWSILFDTDVDILSCDTYSYFDRLLLYPEQLLQFFNSGRILASGIIPTIPEFLDRETAETLMEKWLEQKKRLLQIGVDEERIFAQTLITPSCGTGSLSNRYADRVLELTQAVSTSLREMRP